MWHEKGKRFDHRRFRAFVGQLADQLLGNRADCIFGRVKGEQQGEPTGMAIAGIVISIIAIVYSAIVLVLGIFI